MKGKSALVLVFLTSFLASTAYEAFACGESLYRVGRGVAFRAYSAPVPANVIVYTRSEADKAFAKRLADAGHSVRVVESTAEMTGALGESRFDVVIAPLQQITAVDSNPAATSGGPRFLPVVKHDSADERIARQRYGRSVTARDSFKTYLKAIHRSLKAA